MEEKLEQNLSIKKPPSPLEFLSDSVLRSSYSKVRHYEAKNPHYDIDKIPLQVDEEVINAISILLDETVGNKIDKDTDIEQLDEYAATIGIGIGKWKDENFKGMLRVTLLAKIFENIEYVNKNVTKERLKENYSGKYTADLAHIWLSCLKTKRDIGN